MRRLLTIPISHFCEKARWAPRLFAEDSAEVRALHPVVARWGARELGVRPDTLERDRPKVRAAFDGIAQRLADGRPYLFGDRCGTFALHMSATQRRATAA